MTPTGKIDRNVIKGKQLDALTREMINVKRAGDRAIRIGIRTWGGQFEQDFDVTVTRLPKSRKSPTRHVTIGPRGGRQERSV